MTSKAALEIINNPMKHDGDKLLEAYLNLKSLIEKAEELKKNIADYLEMTTNGDLLTYVYNYDEAERQKLVGLEYRLKELVKTK